MNNNETGLSTPTRLNRSRRMIRSNRILAALVFLMIIEIVAVVAMRTVGLKTWLATGVYGKIGLAIAFSIAPLLIGCILMLRKGRRFSLRSMLIATACFAVFMGITLLPLVRAQRNRIATMAMKEVGAHMDVKSVISSMIRTGMKIKNADDYEFVSDEPGNASPAWLLPIATKLLSIPEDRQIVELQFFADIQLETAERHAKQFSNIKSLIIHTCSSESIAEFVKHLDKFPKLESICFSMCEIPNDCFAGMISIRVLFVNEVPNSSNTLSNSQIQDIGQMPNLEFLSIGNYPLSEIALASLADCQSLKHFCLYSSKITEAEEKAIAETLSGRELHFLPR